MSDQVDDLSERSDRSSVSIKPIEPGATARSLAFEDCDYGTAQLLQIFDCGKTYLFTEILPQLETYYEGNRVKATGRSVKAYRERKLAEPRRKRPTEQLKRKAAEGDAA